MANVFDRLQALQGKSRVEIVAGSAHAEWEKTGLFVSNTGREGTGNLVEIVLAQCGVSAQDKAAPLLKSAMALKETNVATSTSRLAPPILPVVRVSLASTISAQLTQRTLWSSPT